MKALTPWRTNPQLNAVHDELEDIFERFFGDARRGRSATTSFANVPALESFLRDDQIVVRADLPGIDPKEVEIQVEGDRLTLSGERKTVDEDKSRSFREVSYGRFERSVQLPPGVDPEGVKAAYKDGVLEITMPVPRGMVSRKVPVSVH